MIGTRRGRGRMKSPLIEDHEKIKREKKQKCTQTMKASENIYLPSVQSTLSINHNPLSDIYWFKIE